MLSFANFQEGKIVKRDSYIFHYIWNFNVESNLYRSSTPMTLIHLCRFFWCCECIGVAEPVETGQFHFLNLLLSTPSDIQSIKTLKVYCCTSNDMNVYRILSFGWLLWAGKIPLISYNKRMVQSFLVLLCYSDKQKNVV